LTVILPLLVAINMVIGSFKPESESSGKQLAYIEYMGLEDSWWSKWWMRPTFWLCEKIVPGGYRAVFATYYPEEDHPCNELARFIWEEKE
jgi:hypothetical protein